MISGRVQRDTSHSSDDLAHIRLLCPPTTDQVAFREEEEIPNSLLSQFQCPPDQLHLRQSAPDGEGRPRHHDQLVRAVRGGGGPDGRPYPGLVQGTKPRPPHHLAGDTEGGLHQGRRELHRPAHAGQERQHPPPDQHAGPDVEESKECSGAHLQRRQDEEDVRHHGQHHPHHVRTS